MALLFAAIIAHYIGDFPLQGDFIAANKGRYDYLLLVHAAIWTGCICAVLGHFGVFKWWKVAFLLIGHFAIDRWKARKVDKTYALTFDLWNDQVLHLIQIATVTM